MRTLAIANQKGGSGKTTTTVNLAAALAERGRQILLIDLDAQASASAWYRMPKPQRGLLDVLVENAPLSECVQPTEIEGVAMIAASPWLVAAEKILQKEGGAETLLRRCLHKQPEDSWDYLLIDCPPNLGVLTVNALAAVREILIPVGAQVLPLYGLVQLLETVEVIKARLNPELEVTGILACRVDLRTRLAREVVRELRDRFGEKVYDVVIRENVRLAECPSFGRPILTYANRSHGSEDFRALAGEIIEQERSNAHVQAACTG